MNNVEEAIFLLQQCLDEWPYAAITVEQIMSRIQKSVGLLKEHETKSGRKGWVKLDE